MSAAANGSTADFVTANGLKTIHRHVTGNDVVAVQVYFRGGARNINEKDAGVESLASSSGDRGHEELQQERNQREMARMGTAIDATVDTTSALWG